MAEFGTLQLSVFVFLFVAALMSGFPVAYVLAGVGTLFSIIGAVLAGTQFAQSDLDLGFIQLTVSRVFGIMSNYSLVSVPMFVYMGTLLDRSGIGNELLLMANRVLRNVPGGLAVAVILVGTILAASTGVTAASIIMLGSLAIPTMLRERYDPGLSAGTVCVAGGLGSIIPPSIMLIVMADQMAISVGDLFFASFLPGLLLSFLYIVLVMGYGLFRPSLIPTNPSREDAPIGAGELVRTLFAPLLLIVAVLGSIFIGVASPTEAGGVGALGALALTLMRGRLSWSTFVEASRQTARTTTIIMAILIGATCFAVIMRGLEGDAIIQSTVLLISSDPGVVVLSLLAFVFVLGFLLDWIEICLIVLPLALPIISSLQIDPVWFTVLIALTLQTSLITPPVGFSLFYVRGVAPDSITTAAIYRGIMPFVIIQLFCILIVYFVPNIATYLPSVVYK
jgi:tripartite ATP-independent transporter DctM subunit